ncbi:DUF2235 domain-containing protein [Luteimonas sp. MC1825]|uniref:phospholipase effector Tle1 domain-containing protein n=1 Tax=Luteimonas sp. MC1825 TaxID=2761107 RepID=UPI0016163DC4|nr:DUF2235 domain-containing protein [Luteimonas sp. MC1825]MBB6600014.1 DUF2235 domain-containing protein [Luteimonas sp. MC1825]QOC87717.1 DUF2235 domain-containing protein [Luteimonas sp. MC1825]
MGDYRLTPDGIQARQATKEELATLQLAENRLVQLRAPLLLETPRDRVFVAAMDGTGNSLYNDLPTERTIVGRLRDDIRALGHPFIATGYVPGIGTQSEYLSSRIDSLLAVTFEPRVEQAYYQFCVQAAKWIDEDPGVRIHLVGIGFSRGAEQVPALQRLIHERGIRDPTNADIAYGSEGLLTSIKYADRPALVPPGRTVQVAIIHDPVAASIKDQPRAFPSSNISALGFTALHEARGLFDATRHLPDGLSERGRVANFFVPGAHADVGGGYLIDGASRRVQNMDVDYLNTLFGAPLLQKVPVPLDPRMYVIHSSDQHQLGVIDTGHYRRNGERRIHDDLSPGCAVLARDPCARDPVDHALAASLPWRYVERGRTPGGTDPKMDAALAALDRMHAREPTLLDHVAARSTLPMRAEVLMARNTVEVLFDRLADAAKRQGTASMSAVADAYLQTPAGQAFRSGLRLGQAWSATYGRENDHASLGLRAEREQEQALQPHLPAAPGQGAPAMLHP